MRLIAIKYLNRLTALIFISDKLSKSWYNDDITVYILKDCELQHVMHTMWYLMHLSCFVLCHEVPSIRFPSANRLISSVFDDCMLQTVSLYVIVYSVRSSTSLEQSIRTSVRGHFLPSKQTHTEHNAGLVTTVPWSG